MVALEVWIWNIFRRSADGRQMIRDFPESVINLLLQTRVNEVGIVVIGRNEGERLIRCLTSYRRDEDCHRLR